MACVKRDGTFKPYKTDSNFFNVIKIRNIRRCIVCQKNIGCGSYCLNGWSWGGGICLDCSEKVLENGIKGVEGFYDELKQRHQEFKDRFAELKEKNIVNDI